MENKNTLYNIVFATDIGYSAEILLLLLVLLLLLGETIDLSVARLYGLGVFRLDDAA